MAAFRVQVTLTGLPVKSADDTFTQDVIADDQQAAVAKTQTTYPDSLVKFVCELNPDTAKPK